MHQDTLTITGHLDIELRDADGEVIHKAESPNLVTTVGKAVIANRLGMSSPSTVAMTHMAIGTTNTAAAVGDTTLAAENARVALTSSTPSTNTVVYVATFPAGTGTGTIVEAGLLNAGTAGDLLCRSVFSSIAKGASDSLTITWTVTIS